MNWKRKPRSGIILFLACVAILLTPLALRGTSCGQDFDFHLQSWMEAASQWRHGILYPHWVASANYGAGEPRFVFYPPLSWMLGALLGTILPWTWTPIAFALVCLLAMGGACYKMAREWMPSESAAFAACLYIANPYILFVIYERSAWAELLAAAWLPLLILYVLREKPSTPQLALTVAALWLTNAPAAVIGSYTLAVLAFVAAISRRSWKPITRATAGMALGLGLAAVYLIPAVYEQRWVEITRALNIGMRIQDSFLFEHTGMSYHDQVLRTASWIAAFLLIATVAAFALTYRNRRSQSLRAPLFTLTILIAFLQFPISKFLWNAAPKLRYVQFPWRWLLVLGLIFAIFMATTLIALPFRRNLSFQTKRTAERADKERAFLLPAIAILAFAALQTTHAWRHFWILCDDQDNIHAQIDTLHQEGFEGTDEYTPKLADNGDIQQDLPLIRVVSTPDGDQADSSIEENPEYEPVRDDLVPAAIQIHRWQPEHIAATISSPQPGYAVLRLMDYPAWRVRINNHPVSRPTGGPQHPPEEGRQNHVSPDAQSRDDGLLAVPVAAGPTTIAVDYATTPDTWAGRILSLLSLTFWLALAAKTGRQQVS